MAVDMFLKIGDIKGESKDSTHRDWIEIDSWSWGASQSGSAAVGGGMGTGKVSVQDFNFMKRLDKSSPALAQRCATGEHIREATLHVSRNKNDKQTYYEIKLSDVLVSSYQSSGSGADETPTEQISLNFHKIEMLYREIDHNTNKVVGEHTGSIFIKIDL